VAGIEEAISGRAQRDAFARDGVVRVLGAIGAADVAAMRDVLCDALARMPMVELMGAMRPALDAGDALWAIGRATQFAPLPPALARALDGALGAGVWLPRAGDHGGLPMPGLPIVGQPWRVPHAAWHADEPTLSARPDGWGLIAFALLDDVVPGGGATVAIAGSPRRLGALATASGKPRGAPLVTEEALAALASADPWFAALFDPARADSGRFDEPHDSAGIAVRVVELTGAAGDLLLMDARCLHTLSANVSDRPRLAMRLTCGRV
jgi:hypothetical protein